MSEQVNKAAMTIERAREIVGAMGWLHFYTMGLSSIEEMRERLGNKLKGVSLSEMITANEMVRSAPPIDNGDGTKRHQCNCDDRLIAAIYTALHYHPEPMEQCEPLVTVPPVGMWKRSHLVLVVAREGESE